MKMQGDGKYGPWALITGATAGIGRELAIQVAEKKINVVAVARRQSRLDELADTLKERFGVDVRTVQADLRDPAAIERIVAATDGLEIGLLIPNAGAEMSGSFVHSNGIEQVRLAQLNAVAPMQLAHHYGRHMAVRGRGGILFVSSLFAYQGVPHVAHYAATKAYILSLGEALHVELKPYGVDVLVLSPGLTNTEMTANMAIDFSRLPMIPQKPQQVARVGLRALGKKATVVSGLMNKVLAWENRLMPRAAPVALLGFLIQRALKRAPGPEGMVAR
ncbi:MAG: SDR family NAD(P)-dependent oxidoreductase [Nitrospira sp.]|nr:SDR family NAD(P)-dependent oxidoreductase [Nitrospira sp.]